LSQPKHWSGLSVEAQVSDSTSTLSRVRAAIAVRRGRQALLRGDFAWEESLCRDGIVAFRRSLRGEKTVLCVANMGANDTPVVHGELLCASGDVRGNAAGGSVVPPDTTAWFLVD
jgi:alpha-glucosidase